MTEVLTHTPDQTAPQASLVAQAMERIQRSSSDPLLANGEELTPDVDPTAHTKEPFAMWTPVEVPAASDRKKKETYTGASAIEDMDPWVRTLNGKQLDALDSLVKRYRSSRDAAPKPATKIVEKPKVQEAPSDPAWIIARQSAEARAAIDSMAERYVEQRADQAMIPETEAGDDLWVKSLDDNQRRAYDRLVYRQEKRDRERAKVADSAEGAPVSPETTRKVRKIMQWMGQGMVRSSLAINQAQLRRG